MHFTSSISLIHLSIPSKDQRFVMSYTSITPCEWHIIHYVRWHIRQHNIFIQRQVQGHSTTWNVHRNPQVNMNFFEPAINMLLYLLNPLTFRSSKFFISSRREGMHSLMILSAWNSRPTVVSFPLTLGIIMICAWARTGKCHINSKSPPCFYHIPDFKQKSRTSGWSIK